MFKLTYLIAAIGCALSIATSISAQTVSITPYTSSVQYAFRGETFIISRNQDKTAQIPQFYAQTSRACPPFCVQPNMAAEGVETVAELELLDFLVNFVGTGEGFLIDSRTSDYYELGTIPGAVNLPHALFIPNPENAFFNGIMQMLGGTLDTAGNWTFAEPKDLLLFCNGPWCEQSPAAIQNLIAINYPPEKLHYYRGGMQSWVSMGFTTYN